MANGAAPLIYLMCLYIYLLCVIYTRTVLFAYIVHSEILSIQVHLLIEK